MIFHDFPIISICRCFFQPAIFEAEAPMYPYLCKCTTVISQIPKSKSLFAEDLSTGSRVEVAPWAPFETFWKSSRHHNHLILITPENVTIVGCGAIVTYEFLMGWDYGINPVESWCDHWMISGFDHWDDHR